MSREALKCYRSFLRTCQNVFYGDVQNYNIARAKAREEFLKNSNVEDEQAITQLIADAYEAETFLRERVVQLKPTGENSYRLMLNEDKVLADNLEPYTTESSPSRADNKTTLSKPDSKSKH